MEPDSRELVMRATSGDAGAIDRLLEHYLPDLRAYLARNAGELVRAKESASDLAQSVCREVLESLRSGRLRYQGEAQFKQWLYRAALMKAMNRHRFWVADKRDARMEARAKGSSEQAWEPPGRSPTPSEHAAATEELERFARAFAALPENYRQVIALHHVEQLGHAEIAARLSITEANSRMLLSRALARLARLGTSDAT